MSINYEGWVLTTVAGNGEQGYSGDGGPAREATLNNPFDVIFDSKGRLIFTDTFGQRIRRIDLKSGIISTVAGCGGEGYSGDGGLATEATFNQPYGLAVDAGDNIYTADRLNGVVRKIDANGIITTFAGNGNLTFSGDGEAANIASMVEPNGLVFSSDFRSLFIADVSDNRIRVVDMLSGVISTLAGTGKTVHDGDGGPATAAGVFGARAVGIRRSDGAVYVMERQGSCIRLVTPDGKISTVASTGETGYGGDDGAIQNAIFDRPKEMTVNADENILVVDTENHAIRLLDWALDRVSTIAGIGESGRPQDGALAIATPLARPHGIAIGPDGALYIGDTENHQIQRVAPA
tara:strand:+ start:46101 stop:47147 length:1047 start_codon:yes stop_codon:yes gene_type:complete